MLTTLASWLDAYGILLLFGFAFASDLARAGFELAVNFHYRYRSQRTIRLGSGEVAVVIPCHNGADSIAATVRRITSPDWARPVADLTWSAMKEE